jgi:hypothetical protein
MFPSSILCLMQPYFYERIGTWTHEPRSKFNHKKHPFQRFHVFFFLLAFIKSKNANNTFTFCNYTENLKTILLHIISLSLHFVISFY